MRKAAEKQQKSRRNIGESYSHKKGRICIVATRPLMLFKTLYMELITLVKKVFCMSCSVVLQTLLSSQIAHQLAQGMS